MGNPTEDIDREGLVRYYLSKLNLGESPYTSDIIEAGGRDKEVGKRYRRRMSMFGDRRKEEDWRYNSKYGWGHPKNIEFKDAHAVKRHLEKGKSFEDLDDSIKRRVLSEAQIFTHNENRGQDRFYRRYHKDTEVNPFNPEYRMQEAPMPNRAAKERKRLRRKLAVQNKRIKREMKKARKSATEEQNYTRYL